MVMVSYQQRVRSLQSLLASPDRYDSRDLRSCNIRNGIVTIHLDPKAIKTRSVGEGADGEIPTIRTLYCMSIFRGLVVPPMRHEPALLHKARSRGATDCECHEAHI